MENLISVIVPVYNIEAYLRKCIDSILAQTYTNLEIILVDDGSTDNSGEICNEYAAKDARIRVVHKENGGLSSARNTGIDIATGKYIGFVDSDDYIAPDMYEKLLGAIVNNHADISVCNVHHVDENEELISSTFNNCKFIHEVLNKEQMQERLSTDGTVALVVSWNKLYPATIFNHVRFPEGRIHEDEFSIHHIIENCNKMVLIPDSIYYYVKRNESIMTQKYSIKHLDGALAFLDRYDLYAANHPHIAKIPLQKAYTTLSYGLTKVHYRTWQAEYKRALWKTMRKLCKAFDPHFLKLFFLYVLHY